MRGVERGLILIVVLIAGIAAIPATHAAQTLNKPVFTGVTAADPDLPLCEITLSPASTGAEFTGKDYLLLQSAADCNSFSGQTILTVAGSTFVAGPARTDNIQSTESPSLITAIGYFPTTGTPPFNLIPQRGTIRTTEGTHINSQPDTSALLQQGTMCVEEMTLRSDVYTLSGELTGNWQGDNWDKCAQLFVGSGIDASVGTMQGWAITPGDEISTQHTYEFPLFCNQIKFVAKVPIQDNDWSNTLGTFWLPDGDNIATAYDGANTWIFTIDYSASLKRLDAFQLYVEDIDSGDDGGFTYEVWCMDPPSVHEWNPRCLYEGGTYKTGGTDIDGNPVGCCYSGNVIQQLRGIFNGEQYLCREVPGAPETYEWVNLNQLARDECNMQGGDWKEELNYDDLGNPLNDFYRKCCIAGYFPPGSPTSPIGKVLSDGTMTWICDDQNPNYQIKWHTERKLLACGANGVRFQSDQVPYPNYCCDDPSEVGTPFPTEPYFCQSCTDFPAGCTTANTDPDVPTGAQYYAVSMQLPESNPYAFDSNINRWKSLVDDSLFPTPSLRCGRFLFFHFWHVFRIMEK